MSMCKQLDLETLGSHRVCPKISPDIVPQHATLICAIRLSHTNIYVWTFYVILNICYHSNKTLFLFYYGCYMDE
jgi:hypothetical protein